MKCTIDGCARKHLAKGLCGFHYKRKRFGRDLTGPFRPAILLAKTHPVYVAWVNMKTRCRNPRHESYQYYGGRGITICPQWNSFATFYRDMFETWKPGLSLDRENVNGNYEPGNCHWIPLSSQAANRRKRKCQL